MVLMVPLVLMAVLATSIDASASIDGGADIDGYIGITCPNDLLRERQWHYFFTV